MAKHIVPKKVKSWRKTIFTVAPPAKKVVLHFGRPVRYEVVKLDLKDLPPRDRKGKKIAWVNNWGVMSSPDRYVENVRYTVFLPPPPPSRKNAQFVYRDRKGLHYDKTPKYKGKKAPRTGMLQVEFDTGDPATGWM
jgi:hypothetical protein